MKFEISFDHMPEYVLIQTEGEATVGGFEELLTTMVNSPEWVTGTDQIVDHRKLVLGKVVPEEVRSVESVVKKCSEKLGNGRCAFIVKDDLGFGFVRMYELIGGDNIHSRVEVFYTINEAVEWLKQ
jgi:hypothetical protein